MADEGNDKIQISKEELESLIDQRVENKLRRLEAEYPGLDFQEPGGKVTDSKFSRRNFLKILGLGAGGLALSSSVAGWAKLGNDGLGWHEGNDGSGSGLDADTVDGNHVSVGSSPPSSPATDTLFFDTDEEGISHYNGSAWEAITSGAYDTTITVIDDFEDGNTTVKASGWSGWSGGSFSTNTNHLNGNYCLVQTASGVTTATADNDIAMNELSWYCRAANKGSANDGMYIRIFEDSTSTRLIEIRFDYGDGLEVFGDGVEVSGSWSADQDYYCRCYNIDYSNNQFDVEIRENGPSGTVVASGTGVSFHSGNTGSGLGKIDLDSNQNHGGTSYDHYWDDFQYR